MSIETGEPNSFLNRVLYEISRNSCTIPTNTLIHLGPVWRERKAGQLFSFATVSHIKMVVLPFETVRNGHFVWGNGTEPFQPNRLLKAAGSKCFPLDHTILLGGCGVKIRFRGFVVDTRIFICMISWLYLALGRVFMPWGVPIGEKLPPDCFFLRLPREGVREQ